jgi:hypothetical protein
VTYFFNEKKETAKICETFFLFWTRRIFNDGLQHGNNLLRESNTEDDSGFRHFVRMKKSDLRFCFRKFSPESERKIQNFATRYLPATIRLVITLEDHLLSAVRDCLFSIFAATLHTWRPFLHPQPEDAPCNGDSTEPTRHSKTKKRSVLFRGYQ